jgi:hypothetical protein
VNTTSYSSEAVSEIALDSLRAADSLLIKTANSTYCFLVIDPERRRGILTGGALGSNAATSVLVGAEIRTTVQGSGLYSKLCEGARVIFFLAAADRVQQLITSTISKLVHTRAKTTQHSEAP